MAARKTKTRKNRYARWAKYSEYKTLQLVECFARDLPVREAAKLTRMSERTVRDRYADIRGKLLKACIDRPDLFNGFGHLLLDPGGTINLHVLELLFFYSESAAFKRHMAARYPKFRPATDPVLHHVLERAIRRFMAVELPAVSDDFIQTVRQVIGATKSKGLLSGERKSSSTYRARKFYWQGIERQWKRQGDFQVRRYPKTEGEGLFRDLKIMLRTDTI